MLTRDATDEQISRACAELRGAGAVPSTFATDPAASEELLLWWWAENKPSFPSPYAWLISANKVSLPRPDASSRSIGDGWAEELHDGTQAGIARARCIAVLRAAGRME